MKKDLFQLLSVALVFIATSTLVQASTIGVESSSGVNGVQVKQENSQVVVRGSVNRGEVSHKILGAHVHIALLDSKGKVIKDAHQSLPPTAPKKEASRGYRAPYSTTFLQEDAAKASKVKVKYIERSHNECVNKKSC